MNLLMLTPRFPYPPNRGDMIRAWGQLRYLAARHDVWLVAADRVAPSAQSLEAVRAVCADVAVFARRHFASLACGAESLACGRSLTEGYFGDQRITRLLRQWSGRVSFDALLTFSSAMACYSSQVAAPRRVLDMNDVDSFKWESWARRYGWGPLSLYGLEGRRLASAERRWVRSHDLTIVVNQRERERLIQRTGADAVTVVRTGAPPLDRARDATALPSEPVVGMVGSMSYSPNVRAANWFGRWVWPQIRRSVPRARWLIVGRDPTRSVRRLAKLPGVSVTGGVSDVTDLLRSMRVFVAPIQDDLGVQTKLIEALAHGRPAVVTKQVADGMDWRGAPPFLIASDAGNFAQCVLSLLENHALAEHLSQAAQATAREFYDPVAQAAALERHLFTEHIDDALATPAKPRTHEDAAARSRFTQAAAVVA